MNSNIQDLFTLTYPTLWFPLLLPLETILKPDGQCNPRECAGSASWSPPSWSQRKAPQKDVSPRTGILDLPPTESSRCRMRSSKSTPSSSGMSELNRDWTTLAISWLLFKTQNECNILGAFLSHWTVIITAKTLVLHPRHSRYHVDPSVSLSPFTLSKNRDTWTQKLMTYLIVTHFLISTLVRIPVSFFLVLSTHCVNEHLSLISVQERGI